MCSPGQAGCRARPDCPAQPRKKHPSWGPRTPGVLAAGLRVRGKDSVPSSCHSCLHTEHRLGHWHEAPALGAEDRLPGVRTQHSMAEGTGFAVGFRGPMDRQPAGREDPGASTFAPGGPGRGQGSFLPVHQDGPSQPPWTSLRPAPLPVCFCRFASQSWLASSPADRKGDFLSHAHAASVTGACHATVGFLSPPHFPCSRKVIFLAKPSAPKGRPQFPSTSHPHRRRHSLIGPD